MARVMKQATNESMRAEPQGVRMRADGAETGSSRPPKSPRKSLRRRQIDPTTCDRDYSPEEVEFMQAMEAYKRSSGRMFPTCSEILEVFKTLGYRRDALVATADRAP